MEMEMEIQRQWPHALHNQDNTTVPTTSDQRDGRVMSKLKDSILARVAASNPSKPVTKELCSYVEEKLRGFFPNFDTPSHPPYASMIQSAIVSLNEEGGSSKESISGFIREKNEDLPRQHEAFLSHHLRRLCMTGEIVLTNNGRYMLAVKCGDFGDRKEMGHRMNIRQGRQSPRKHRFRYGLQRQLMEKGAAEFHLMKQDNDEKYRAEGHEVEVIDEWNKVKEQQIEVFEKRYKVKEQAVEERNEAAGQDTKSTEDCMQRPGVELDDEEQNNPQYQQTEVLEEPSHLEELQSAASEEHASACEQQNVVILKQYKPQNRQTGVFYEKQMDDQVIVTIPNASETSSQCLGCNDSPLSLEEPCVDLVKKKSEFQEKLTENSHSLGKMELPKYATGRLGMEEEKKDCLEVEQQHLTKSSLTDSESSIEVIDAHSKLQHQENELLLREESQQLEKVIETEILGLCCFKGNGESYFIMEKDEEKKRLEKKQHKQQRKITCGERKVTIICGLLAQKLSEPKIHGRRRACNSGPCNGDKHRSLGQARSLPLPNLDTVIIMGNLLPSKHHHDDEQHQPDQGQRHAQSLSKSKFYGQQRAWKSDTETDQQHRSSGQAKCLSGPEPDTDMTMSYLLPSVQHLKDEQRRPEDEGQVQGRFQKAKSGRDCQDHKGLRVYVRRKRKILITYVRHKRKA